MDLDNPDTRQAKGDADTANVVERVLWHPPLALREALQLVLKDAELAQTLRSDVEFSLRKSRIPASELHELYEDAIVKLYGKNVSATFCRLQGTGQRNQQSLAGYVRQTIWRNWIDRHRKQTRERKALERKAVQRAEREAEEAKHELFREQLQLLRPRLDSFATAARNVIGPRQWNAILTAIPGDFSPTDGPFLPHPDVPRAANSLTHDSDVFRARREIRELLNSGAWQTLTEKERKLIEVVFFKKYVRRSQHGNLSPSA